MLRVTINNNAGTSESVLTNWSVVADYLNEQQLNTGTPDFIRTSGVSTGTPGKLVMTFNPYVMYKDRVGADLDSLKTAFMGLMSANGKAITVIGLTLEQVTVVE